MTSKPPNQPPNTPPTGSFAAPGIDTTDGERLSTPLPVSLEPLNEAIDWTVLRHLEDLEQEHLNFGLYETFFSVAEVQRRSQNRDGERALPTDAVEAALRRLQAHYWLFSPAPGRFRSRISEIVRLLKNLKRLWRAEQAGEAPFVIQSLRVHFQDRRRLEWDRPFLPALGRLFEEHRDSGLRYLDRACRAVREGFADALGKPAVEVQVTRIQEEALGRVGGSYLRRRGQGYVITGNTGSGKTEAALLPLLVGALQEKMVGIDGCKVLLVYPRQALAKNQLDRLVRYLATVNRCVHTLRGVSDRALTLGIVFGETPVDDEEMRRGAFRKDKVIRRPWREAPGGYVLPYFTTADGASVHALDLQDGVCTLQPAARAEEMAWRLEGFKATRQAIHHDPPDVLIITTEMLHHWLTDPHYNEFFGLPRRRGRAPRFCAPRAVVFDEIHLYEAVHGAQVGLLLRRLRHRLRQAFRAVPSEGWEYPLVLGMSATIGNPEGFWRQLSGVPIVTPITPAASDLGQVVGREYFLFIRPETYSRGQRVGDRTTAILTAMAVAHNMPRRAAANGVPAKFRTLVFQDSIGKLKQLTVEFHDFESRQFHARQRFLPVEGDPLRSPRFHDGEYWYFALHDQGQYSERRRPGSGPVPLTSATVPVFSATSGRATRMLHKDVIFATTALEVGYDDPTIQFVLQHHAPRNSASFVQKKGRAGRSLHDRPITAVTLSPRFFKDTFYYQNPQLLYDPADYTPALNVENYFVQRFQALALLFDELARLTGRDLLREQHETLQAHLASVDAVLSDAALNRPLQYAYEAVTADSLRRIHSGWRDVWEWFRRRMGEDDVGHVKTARSLLERCPDLPKNLFSTLNLPTVRVMCRTGEGESAWELIEEDLALAFTEVAPGKVTRRYGSPWRHLLFWRPPDTSSGKLRNTVALERYKPRDGKPGPFNPVLLKPLRGLWGPHWRDYLPLQAHAVYADGLPDSFYRIRFIEMWNFGTLNPEDPMRPQPDWKWYGIRRPDGSADLRFDGDETFRQNERARQVLPESTSTPLAFSVVTRHLLDCDRPAPPRETLSLPPLFCGVVERVEFFFGGVGEQSSLLHVCEVQYGAEATIYLKRKSGNDPHAGLCHNLIRYVSEHNNRATLYGHDVTTEGLRIPYDEDRLRSLAREVLERVKTDLGSLIPVCDEYLRFLLKARPWPVEGLEQSVTAFDRRVVADLLSTLRADSRAECEKLDDFLRAVTSRTSLQERIDRLTAEYWRDHRTFADPDFRERLFAALTAPRAFEHLQGSFRQVASAADLRDYLVDTILHSLKHALRNLVVAEGCARDEEIGSHGMLGLTYGRRSPEGAFYVHERNQGGNGAARLVAQVCRERGPGYLLRAWWDRALACPVGDEEDFLRYILRRNEADLVSFQREFFAAPPEDRPSPRGLLVGLTRGWMAVDDPLLGRLATLVTGEFSFSGEQLPQLGLVLEVLRLERELSTRFLRRPSAPELAGAAATAAEGRAGAFPLLRRLYDVYERHAAAVGLDDEAGAAAHPLDRFLTQVEHFSLSTCVDVCPACLATDCEQGPLEVTRHALSRRWLKAAHKILTAPFTRPYGADPAMTLAALARDHVGYLILEHSGPADPAVMLVLRDAGFEGVGRVLEYQDGHEPLVRQVLHLRGGA